MGKSVSISPSSRICSTAHEIVMPLKIASLGLLSAGLYLGEMTHGVGARIVAPVLLLGAVATGIQSVQRRAESGRKR
jgi:hypothetical protein